MQPRAINSDNSKQLAARLDEFDRWFWQSELRNDAAAIPLSDDVPVVLAWAIQHNRFAHRFLAEPQPDGRLYCFEECGNAFSGHLDSLADNPFVTFGLPGEPGHPPPVHLNDLVVGAYFESIARGDALRRKPNLVRSPHLRPRTPPRLGRW
jgi:hypothetical protein